MMSPESGNVIFMILIAVTLFAALSYTVSGMINQDSAQNVTEERAQLLMTEMISTTRAMRQSIRDMRISNGCQPEDMSFENGLISGYEHAPEATEECKLFSPQGGGLSYVRPDPQWLDTKQEGQVRYGQWFFTGESCVSDVGNGTEECASDGDVDNSELIVALPWLSKQICEIVNEQLGISDKVIPKLGAKAWDTISNPFVGDFSEIGVIESSGNDAALLRGKTAGCFEGAEFPPVGSYTYYQVLVAR